MALIVEDGTAKADADSLETLDNYKAYCTARGLDLAGRADEDLESDLRNATSYLDGYRFRDVRRTADQATEWPRREGAVDRDGHALPDAPPLRIRQAVCELAFIAKDGPLLPPSQRGIKSETIGPISTTYDDPVNGISPIYGTVDRMLRIYLRIDDMPPQAFNMGPTTAPFFDVTLHDPPEGTAPGGTGEDEV